MSALTRAAALFCAVRIPQVRNEGLTETLLCASVLDRWLRGHPSPGGFLPGVRNGNCCFSFLIALHDSPRIGKKLSDVFTAFVGWPKNIARRLFFRLRDGHSDFPDKTRFGFWQFGHGIFFSNAMPDSGDSGATDPRADDGMGAEGAR